MTRTMLSPSLLVAALLFANQSAAAGVGKPAPAFAAVDSLGHSITLANLKGSFVVLEWMDPNCPFTRKHYDSGNMQQLQRTFTAKGVLWFSVNTSLRQGPDYTPPGKLNAWSRKLRTAPTALLMDSDTSLARLYGAKTTPHVFVIDPRGILIYAGAIDDKRSTDADDIVGANNFVRAALEEALAGKAVTVPTTNPYGCAVEYQ
jgi:hypothetical protein